jgi:hypothetical protein
MGTMTITSNGFAVLPAQAPKNWPSNLTWPGGGSINASKAFTISDADAQQILSWLAENYNAVLVGTGTPPVTKPATAYFLAWLQGFMNATTDSVQRQQSDPMVVPPPISIA